MVECTPCGWVWVAAEELIVFTSLGVLSFFMVFKERVFLRVYGLFLLVQMFIDF